MEKTTAGALQKWEHPTLSEIRVSAEVTAYVAVLGGDD